MSAVAMKRAPGGWSVDRPREAEMARRVMDAVSFRLPPAVVEVEEPQIVKDLRDERDRLGIPRHAVLSTRTPNNSALRAAISASLRAKGHQWNAIGTVLGIDHTSAIYAAERDTKVRTRSAVAFLQSALEELKIDDEMFGRVLSTTRHKDVVAVRESLCVRLRNFGLSYPEIARLIGRRTHSTVITAVRRVLARVENHEGV